MFDKTFQLAFIFFPELKNLFMHGLVVGTKRAPSKLFYHILCFVPILSLKYLLIYFTIF